ncbi:hypothetical protein CLC_2729 [Clostridium botulinum A str. Hall]|nr:hypothetical protein CLB_2796 [Clostridium botulinum A str. ATCC 19397]ABS38444.1 hypothetical protein CLC_2729 [Clostridium botulinum A str. Hall]
MRRIKKKSFKWKNNCLYIHLNIIITL